VPLNISMGVLPAPKKFKGIFVFLLLGTYPALLARPAGQSSDKNAKLYLRESRIERFPKPILAFDIASGSDLAAAAFSDLRVRIWRLNSGRVVHEFSFPEPVTDQRLKLDVEVEPICLHFSPDGMTLAVSFLNVIHLFDVATWQEKKNLAVKGEEKLRPGITVTLQTPQLSRRTPSQAQAQSEQPNRDINQTMREWAAQRDLGDGRTRVRDFTFVKGGLFILASYCRGACWVWPGVRWDVFPSGNDPVRLWDLRSAKVVWEKSYDPRGVTSRVVPSPDGKRFAAVDSELGRCAVDVYDLSGGRALWSHPLGPCDQPPCIAFLSSGQSFITNRVEEGSRKRQLWRTAAIYETSTGKKVADLSDKRGMRNADISSDGRWLVSTTWRGREFQIWDMRSKKIVITQVPKALKRWILDRVRFSPDDRWLVVGSNATTSLAIYEFGEASDLRPEN
jgi:WD40 repeat protein